MRKYFLNLYFIFIPGFALSQYASINSDTNLIYTNYENNINNVFLKSNINFSVNYKKFNITARNIFNSDVSKLGENYYRDYNNFIFNTNYNITSKLSSGFGYENKVLSDNKAIELNKNKENFLFSSANYKINDNINVNARLGYKNDEQISEYTSGFNSIFSTDINALNINNYISNAKILLNYENLLPKINYDFELNGNVDKVFSKKSENRGEARIYNIRSDYYIPASTSIINLFNIRNNIQSRKEDYIFLSDELKYSLTNNLLFNITGKFRYKNINFEYRYKTNSSSTLTDNIYDTKILENYLEAGAGLQYNISFMESKFQINYSERSEQHNPINTINLSPQIIRELEEIEKNKNNFGRYTTLYFELLFPVSNTNKFRFLNTSSILRYDTDSKLNYDDRDETFFIYYFSHSYTNLRNFKIETVFDINIYKTKYLFKEKSANNNTNRIYKLTSSSFYAPVENLITKNQFQVLANYTVYDYEDIISQIKSYSFRQVSLKDSVIYNFSKKIVLNILSDIKFYEQGEFNNNEFSEKPLMLYDEKSINSSISYFIFENMNITLGIKFFEQKQYEYNNGNKNLKRDIKNRGPFLRLSFLINEKSFINLIAGRDYYFNSINSTEEINNSLILNIQWYK